MDRTRDLHERGKPKEVLTVDNHADGPYVYLRMLREKDPRAEDVLKLLQMNEGKQFRAGYRVRQLGRRSPCGPVLAALPVSAMS